MPPEVPGHTSSFPLGGTASPKVTWKNRINLTLGYDPSTPNGQDIAVQIRTRLEDTGGLSVKLVAGEPNADLVLLDRKAWTATALAWLQPYLDAPLRPPPSRSARSRPSSAAPPRRPRPTNCWARCRSRPRWIWCCCRSASPRNGSTSRAGTEMSEVSFGPGWQLGLWGISNG